MRMRIIKDDHNHDEDGDDDQHRLDWTWLITGCQRIKGGADFSLLFNFALPLFTALFNTLPCALPLFTVLSSAKAELKYRHCALY